MPSMQFRQIFLMPFIKRQQCITCLNHAFVTGRMNILLVLHTHVHVASYIFISKWTNAFININVGIILGLDEKKKPHLLIALANVDANKLYFYILHPPASLRES